MPGAWETHMWVKDNAANEWVPWTGSSGGGGAESNIAINAFDSQAMKSLPCAGTRGLSQFSNQYTKLQIALTDDNNNPLGYGNRPILTREGIQLNLDYRDMAGGLNAGVHIINNTTNASYSYIIDTGGSYHSELGSLIISNTSQTDAWLKLFVNMSGKEIIRFFAPKNETRVYSGHPFLIFAYAGEDLIVAAESNVDSLYINGFIRYIT